jgi:hypothetical protein
MAQIVSFIGKRAPVQLSQVAPLPRGLVAQTAGGIIDTGTKPSGQATMLTKFIAGNPLERFFSLTGLALNAIFVINVAVLFAPPRFLNPAWEVQTINAIVSLAPVLLLGVALSGGGKYLQERPETFRPLQIYCYIFAGVFALSIPLYTVDSIRLYGETASRIDQQSNRVISEIERQEDRLENLLKSGGLPPAFDSNRAKERIATARSQTLKEAEDTRRQSLIGFVRLAAAKLASLLVVAFVLASLGRLCQFAARGITLDPTIQN